jgi:hypothetical protein
MAVNASPLLQDRHAQRIGRRASPAAAGSDGGQTAVLRFATTTG